MEALDTLHAPPLTDFSDLHVDVRSTIESLLTRLGPNASFGEPVRNGEFTVIPVAEVRVGFGLGSGFGRDAKVAPEDSTEGGGGGGAGGRIVPRGFIRIGPEGARFTSAPDVTRLALAGMALAALAALAAGKLLER